jgi:hypothetical protein
MISTTSAERRGRSAGRRTGSGWPPDAARWQWLRRKAVGASMNVLIAVAVASYFAQDEQ